MKMIKTSTFAIAALISSSLSSTLVNASFSSVKEGVVRIDLEKKYIDHGENLMLSDTVDVDKMLLIDE
jgi:hypothetical protein